jgi:collagen type VII alpha
VHKFSKGLLCSSKPVMVVTALVAVLGISGTAYGAKLITGLDIRDGSITTVDLSKNARASLHGAKGAKGANGAKGDKGAKGNAGTPGATGATGLTGLTGIAGEAGTTGVRGLTGTSGTNGIAGTNGTNGTAGTNAVSYFAAVTGPGVKSTTRVRGVASVAHTTSTGIYDVTLTGTPDASTCVAVAQVTSGPGFANAIPDAVGHVAVHTYLGVGNGTTTFTGDAADRDFVVTVSC